MKDEKDVGVGLISHYLWDNWSDMSSEERTQEINKHMYDDNNLQGVQILTTPRGRNVHLITPKILKGAKWHEDIDEYVRVAVNPEAMMTLAGSTIENETAVLIAQGSGSIIARYSKFYGGPSGYSGHNPEETGYSLDIPKRMDAVRGLLNDDDVLDAIVERDFRGIQKSIAALNNRLQTPPILITPYLEVALSITPGEKAIRENTLIPITEALKWE